MKKILLFVFLAFSSTPFAFGNISLPAIFSSNMVLQQNAEITIWGWANPQEKIKVSTNWDSDVESALTNNYANWSVILKTPSAGGPFTITITGSNTIELENVMSGEVWLCSGQSNMEMSADWGITDAKDEIAAANYPNIRFFQVDKRAAPDPQIDLNGTWTLCTPETMRSFSAAGYFFGRELNRNLNVPIGLINSSWGGTAAETWINPTIISSDNKLSAAASKISDTAPWCPGKPGSTYNSMIAPIIHYVIAGVIWYQGEGNTANPESYANMFTTLIKDWRNEWNKDLPFYYVQIAPYKYDEPYVGVLIREAQLKCLSVPNTGMIVTSDIGNLEDIHPKDKKDVGIRLAQWALSKTYNKQGLSYSGPVYHEMKTNKNKIILSFDYAGNGLVAKGGTLSEFQIAGADKVFVDADAKIVNNTIVVQSKKVKLPVAVRFGFSNLSNPNLFNSEGLPASCFRTDDWEIDRK